MRRLVAPGEDRAWGVQESRDIFPSGRGSESLWNQCLLGAALPVFKIAPAQVSRQQLVTSRSASPDNT